MRQRPRKGSDRSKASIFPDPRGRGQKCEDEYVQCTFYICRYNEKKTYLVPTTLTTALRVNV